MTAALAALADAPCVGLDATPAGERLYRHYGFVAHYSLARTKVQVDATRIGIPSGDARPIEGGDFAAVFAEDRRVFGADRSRLLRSLFARAPECAWIATDASGIHGADASGIHGYTFGRAGHLYSQLGPIVARDSATARNLVSHCLSRQPGRRFAIDVPRSDQEWLPWLISAGFVEERSFVRMFLRGHVHPGIPARQYAICGPEFA